MDLASHDEFPESEETDADEYDLLLKLREKFGYLEQTMQECES